jgi:CHAD domain-containing protein
MTIGEAFRVIGINCLRHVAANETAVAKGDSEGIHQMRVGLRRLRAAISVFGEMLPDPQTGWIKTELKWLASQLAPARDLDVFLSESVEPVRRAQPAKRELHTLRTELEGRRAKAFAAVRQAVQSPRYRTLLLDTLKWLETGDWTRNDDTRSWRERPIKAFARETLARRSAKVVKKAKKVEELDDLARHKLRIAIKKLRYTAEFFAGLFAGRKAEKRSAAFQDALKELQACLGKLNDIAVHEKLAARLIHGETPGGGRRIRNGSAFAVGVVSGRQQSRIAPILRAAAKAASAFARVRAFWKA